ncbi:hypothetical protein [Saccharopolyspora sp. ASAGF58]|uniref:hypothetical protein n=1 Tax=Saccharopolyspora sp. ASAGF58 TaxID=2719023 RepID=UPI00144006EB|nr:hypothetical protein [Saccharopolyspora sp. ASAGF58]QIZ37030.1 hypothetical protein FDZ84_23255 [Saccharopolyspora sp. ASAGF58]
MALWRFAAWNVWDLYRSESRAEEIRQKRLYPAITDTVRPDILGVQEIIAPADGGGDALKRLTDATGMIPGTVARGHQIAPQDLYYWVGLLWAEDIQVKPGSERDYRGEMWHNLVTSVIVVDGVTMRVGSYHAPPFGRYCRSDEAERVVSAFTRPRPPMPGIYGSDSNGLSGDRVQRPDGIWVLYDRIRRGKAASVLLTSTLLFRAAVGGAKATADMIGRPTVVIEG